MSALLLTGFIHFAATVWGKGTDLPNIVFIYADDLGIGDVGCFGNTTLRTPNIDSICENGVKLSHHLAAAPVCTPSRAALLTSRYPIRTGFASPNNLVVTLSLMSSAGLPASEYTLPQMLKSAGYTTALIGKWHLGLDCGRDDRCHSPTKFGFDYFFGTPLSNFRNLSPKGGDFVRAAFPRIRYITFSTFVIVLITVYVIKKFISGRFAFVFLVINGIIFTWLFYILNFPRIYNSVLQRNNDIVELPINFERMSQRLVNEGIQFLEKRYEDKKPFFLMMSWLQVHTFLHATKPHTGNSAHGPYGDEVEEMDWSTGEILKALKQLELDKNTIVYFSSDNGGHKEEEDGSGRQTGGWNGIYTGSKGQGGQEGAIRMPTAIMWRGRLPEGTEVTEPTSQMDLMVTLAEIVGRPMPTDRHIDGKNILPLLEGKTNVSPHEALFHYCGDWLHSVRFRPREGDAIYKLHYAWPKWLNNSDTCGRMVCACYTYHYPLSSPKLFNIVDDPREKAELDITLPRFSKILAQIEEAKRLHQLSTVDSHPHQLGALNQLGLPWKHPFCKFPFTLFCHDDKNALNYEPKYYES